MSAARASRANVFQNDGPVKAASTPGRQSSDRSPVLGLAAVNLVHQPGQAQIAGVRICPQPPRPLARDQRRLAVGCAGADRVKRLRDPTRDELVVPCSVRSFVDVYRALTDLT